MTVRAQLWTIRGLWLFTLAGAAIFCQDWFRQTGDLLVIAGIGFLGGPVVLGAIGGFKPLAAVAAAAFLLIAAFYLVHGIDQIGLDLPECGPRDGFSPDPCGPSMAARSLAGTYPALIIMGFGSIPAAVRLIWRKRSD